jgi:hypothetical protein
MKAITASEAKVIIAELNPSLIASPLSGEVRHESLGVDCVSPPNRAQLWPPEMKAALPNRQFHARQRSRLSTFQAIAP